MKIFRVLKSSIKVGDFVKERRRITQKDLDAFSSLTGDFNPLHCQQHPQKSLVHGAFLNSIVAGLIGTQLPGARSLVTSQNFSFPSKCYVDDEIEITVEIADVRKIIKIKYKCVQNNSVVFEGEARLVMNKST